MRTAITIGIPAGPGAKPDILSGPEVPISDQKRDFKALVDIGESSDYVEVQLWTSGNGCISRKRLKQRAETKPAKKHQGGAAR